MEEVIEKTTKKEVSSLLTKKKGIAAVGLMEVDVKKENRVKLSDQELNRVLGGGLVAGSIILLGGEPGIGKSTLLLQLAVKMHGTKVLYISGEESETQIKMRAERIGINNDQCFLLTETSTTQIFKQCELVQPDLLVIDSIQTVTSPHIESTAGSISQIRECAGELQKYAKLSGVPVFLVGHINKEGQIAGPKILEHVVDTVLSFEGDRNHAYRILRSVKNRFGSTSELGIYEMRSNGLREVDNPSELLLGTDNRGLSGCGIAAMVEGMRPMMIETQALVSPAVYSHPQRTTTGFDLRRLQMLLAVLEKRLGLQLGNRDVFLNIAGGLRVDDPGIDLAIIASLMSSYTDQSLSPKLCFTGEVGLAGEIRSVQRIEPRISEADKLGFEKIYVPSSSVKNMEKRDWSVEVCPIRTVIDLQQAMF